jgi:cinnamyl-alcohol dehydrogenase
MVLTSNGVGHDGTTTQGSFSDVLLVSKYYVLQVPESLPLAGAAPLLCVGVIVYNPIVQFGLNTPRKQLITSFA